MPSYACSISLSLSMSAICAPVLGASSARRLRMFVVEWHPAGGVVRPLPAGGEDRDHDGHERRDEQDHRDLGVGREVCRAHDVGEPHQRLPPAVAFLRSRPRRCRYAVTATISLSASPFGPPAASTDAATCAACARAISGALLTASPYGTPTIAIASTDFWMAAKSMTLTCRCG